MKHPKAEPFSEPKPETTNLDPIIPIAPAGDDKAQQLETMTALIVGGMIGNNPMNADEAAAKGLAIAIAIRLAVKKLGEIPLPGNPDVIPDSANAPVEEPAAETIE